MVTVIYVSADILKMFKAETWGLTHDVDVMCHPVLDTALPEGTPILVVDLDSASGPEHSQLIEDMAVLRIDGILVGAHAQHFTDSEEWILQGNGIQTFKTLDESLDTLLGRTAV